MGIRLFVQGGANAHAAFVLKFPLVVPGVALLHLGPLLVWRIHRSWRGAGLVSVGQALLGGLLIMIWFQIEAAQHRSIENSILWRLLQSMPELGLFCLGLFLVNVLPLAIGGARKSWKTAVIVALVQPLLLAFLALLLVIFGGIASPR